MMRRDNNKLEPFIVNTLSVFFREGNVGRKRRDDNEPEQFIVNSSISHIVSQQINNPIYKILTLSTTCIFILMHCMDIWANNYNIILNYIV